MNRATRRWIVLLPLVALEGWSGCVAEPDVDAPLTVTGQVTYHGEPIKRGLIHFLAVGPTRPPATGTILDGAIKDVYTKRPGDGVKPGKYRLAITSFDDDLLQSAAKRDANGPDPVEVARAANQIKPLIPPRYSNPLDSGLTAELAPGQTTLRLDLVD